MDETRIVLEADREKDFYQFLTLVKMLASLTKGRLQKKKLMENSNKALIPPRLLEKKKTKNDLRATKRILYDMGNFFDANRPCYGLSLFYF